MYNYMVYQKSIRQNISMFNEFKYKTDKSSILLEVLDDELTNKLCQFKEMSNLDGFLLVIKIITQQHRGCKRVQKNILRKKDWKICVYICKSFMKGWGLKQNLT